MTMKRAPHRIGVVCMISLIVVLSCAFLTKGLESRGFAGARSVNKSPADTDQINSTEITVPPADLNLDPFYKKYLDANGIPIISSEKVPDEALFVVQRIVNKMLSKRSDVREKMIENKIRVGVMGKTELTLDMPEFRTLQQKFPDINWNEDRGDGATLATPLSSCAEENVLCYGEGNDPYNREDITIHEFTHGIHNLGILAVDPNFDNELENALKAATESGHWINTYAATNVKEYFAEGVQDWFNVNDVSIPSNGIHNEIHTRQQLKEYDPTLYNIIKRYFPEDDEKISCHQK